MEYLEGETLKERIGVGARHGPPPGGFGPQGGVPLPTETLLDLAIQIADVLDAAHTKDVVPGADYTIQPINISETYRWSIKKGLVVRAGSELR